MRLEKVETWVRWAGALDMLVLLTLVFEGLWRGSRRRKGRTVGAMPKPLRSFRFYVLASIVGLVPFYRLWRPLQLSLPVPARVAALLVGALLYFPGLALTLWGRLALGEMYDVSSGFGAQLYANHKLVTSGPYARVRHPMYLGGMLTTLGALLIYRTWLTLLVAPTFTAALALRAHREEEALAAEFGAQWQDYHRRVPGWIPRLRP